MAKINQADAVSAVEATGPGEAYLAGNFGPIETETTAFNLKVIGNLPKELTGRLLRIGPNPQHNPEPGGYHWFTGSGMAHGLRLRDGKAEWYRSRVVNDVVSSAALGRAPIGGPGAGFRDTSVNTNFISLNGKIYACVEAGALPVELNYELESVARSDFGGTLEAGFTGHPKYDPLTGEQLALAYEPGQPVRYISVSREGVATTKARIDLPHIPLIHDMAFTEKFIVVPDFPVTFQPERARTMFPWYWDERRASRIGLLPRDGDVSKLQWFETPRVFAFHFVNAYDEGDLTIVDLIPHPKAFDTDYNGPNEGAPVMVRWTLDRRTGRLSETELDDHGNEFPRINGRFGGQKYRYAYSSQWWGGDASRGPAMKHDMLTGKTEVHDYGLGRLTMEPVFVRKPGAKAEDEGWVMSYVYDSARDKTDVVVLDAQGFTDGPVATVELPVRVPFGFHGGWAPDEVKVVE